MHHLPDPIRRRSLAAAAALVASAVASPTVRAQTRGVERTVAIAVGGRTAMSSLPLNLAVQLGYFRAEGLDVNLIDSVDEAAALRLLASGAAQVASCSFEHTIRQQGRGQALQAIVMLCRAPQVSFGVSGRTLSEYRQVSDLRGRRIGVAATESTSQSLVAAVLGRGGLDPADVNLVSVGQGHEALGTLRSGQIDAISNLEPVMTMLEHRGDVRMVAETRTLAGTQTWLGGPVPGASLCAPFDFVQKAPGVCQALAHAIVRALKWLRTAGPGDIVRAVPESHWLGDRGLYLMSLAKVSESFSIDGLMSEDGSRAALRVLTETDASVRAGHVNLGRAYTNAFALQAKERFKA